MSLGSFIALWIAFVFDMLGGFVDGTVWT